MAPIRIGSSRRRAKFQLQRPNGSRPSWVPRADRAAGTARFRRRRLTQAGGGEPRHVGVSRLLGGTDLATYSGQ
jgi:hypothetical protein